MSTEVQEMFSSIASRYDLANDVLSLGAHRLWKHKVVGLADVRQGQTVLDLCCGTGDLAFACKKAVGQSGKVFALDFSLKMIEYAKKRAQKLSSAPIFFRGDAMNIPLGENSVDLVTIAFGIRNVDNPLECLRGIFKVLKPGGRVMVLEFGQPQLPGFKSIYKLYSDVFMPRIGGAITGNQSAYRYLPETSARFTAGKDFLNLLSKSGFEQTRLRPFLSGLAYCYLANKT
jgi:demethylmenaquinone methyltransferase/2-methoxy-6-polyprenyl-1,4-benzoquinol methylase